MAGSKMGVSDHREGGRGRERERYIYIYLYIHIYVYMYASRSVLCGSFLGIMHELDLVDSVRCPNNLGLDSSLHVPGSFSPSCKCFPKHRQQFLLVLHGPTESRSPNPEAWNL